jgi:orotate phosphoribosyltransferase
MTENKIAAALLEIAAIKLRPHEPFKWASGWNSPIYCDNRLSLSFPKVRGYIKESIIKAIQENFKGVEGIAGVATAGIPQGAIVSEGMSLPFIYVRPKPKEHGMGNLIEGKITPGQKVVVIEDLISTGGSSLKAVEALKESGFEVLGMVAIFSYGFKIADDNFKKAAVKLVSLSNYDALIDEAIKTKYAKISDLELLKTWRKDPANWMQTGEE